ncbi:Cof-type HAD-IIB family hydrolase [Patescibacteria group bacterium]|nr:Cof-type HAD-IIB family hydrolase [Patescibacteria group bacterium]
MKYKLLILDVDGTIIESRKDASVSEKVAEAIRQANKFVKVCLCTGRTYNDVKNLIKVLNIQSSYHVIESGTKVMNSEGKLEYAKSLSEDDLEEIIEFSDNLPSGYGFCVDGIWKSKLEDIRNGLVTVLTLHSEDREQTKSVLKQIDRLKEKFNIHVGSKWDKPDGAYIAITNKEASKEFGLKYIQEKLGIKKEETIGVGDFPNDLPLFKVSGLKVAMGNAEESLKNAADIIAPSLKDDGVAWVIDKYVLNSL